MSIGVQTMQPRCYWRMSCRWYVSQGCNSVILRVYRPIICLSSHYNQLSARLTSYSMYCLILIFGLQNYLLFKSYNYNYFSYHYFYYILSYENTYPQCGVYFHTREFLCYLAIKASTRMALNFIISLCLNINKIRQCKLGSVSCLVSSNQFMITISGLSYSW